MIEPGQIYDGSFNFRYIVICPRKDDADIDGSWWAFFFSLDDESTLRLTWLWNESFEGMTRLL